MGLFENLYRKEIKIFLESLHEAKSLVVSLDPDLIEILLLSIKINLISLAMACIIGLPAGSALAVLRFPTRKIVIATCSALMSLPPVVVGLIVYLYLSRNGPLGWLELLYTPAAMIIAQVILITPIIITLSCQIIEDLQEDYREYFSSLVISHQKAIFAYIYDARYSLITVVLAGFGRAISEVGAVIIVGGNIDHLTRVMTTTISLETSKGNLPLALALGIILLIISLSVNFTAAFFKNFAKRNAYV